MAAKSATLTKDELEDILRFGTADLFAEQGGCGCVGCVCLLLLMVLLLLLLLDFRCCF